MLQVEEMPFRAGWSYEGGIQQACTGYLLEEEGGGGSCPRIVQSSYGDCESGWGAVTGGWKCGLGRCWGVVVPLGKNQGWGLERGLGGGL